MENTVALFWFVYQDRVFILVKVLMQSVHDICWVTAGDVDSILFTGSGNVRGMMARNGDSVKNIFPNYTCHTYRKGKPVFYMAYVIRLRTSFPTKIIQLSVSESRSFFPARAKLSLGRTVIQERRNDPIPGPWLSNPSMVTWNAYDDSLIRFFLSRPQVYSDQGAFSRIQSTGYGERGGLGQHAEQSNAKG